MTRALPWILLVVLDLVGLALSTAQVSVGLEVRLWGAVVLVALAGLGLRRLRARRLSAVSLALARTWAAMLLLLFGSVYTTPWTGPLADGVLGLPDHGATGVALDAWIQRVGLWDVATVAYNSGQAALVAVLVLSPRARSSLPDALALTGVVGIGAYLLAPVAGPSVGGAWAQPGWSDLRAGLPVTYDTGIPGLIGCPSFHSVAAVLLVLASDAKQRWITVPWSAILIGTAFTVGGHYPVDLAAGACLGAWGWFMQRRGVR